MAISGRQLRFRRWLSCDLVGYCEIATSAFGLLAMTNSGDLRHRMCYNHCRPARRSLPVKGTPPTAAQGTPLQTQLVCTFLSAPCTNWKCLPEIAPQGHFLALRAQGATAPLGPRNDNSGAITVLPSNCTGRPRGTRGRLTDGSRP